MSHIVLEDHWRASSDPADAESVQPKLSGAIRAIDLLVATLALIVFSPLMVFLALLTFATDGGPILYTHHRRGRGGKRFGCLKFRTMRTDSDEQLRHLLETSPEARAEWARDHKLRNDPRVTPGGAFLRRMSLDELPQLFNVLRGDMSIVGPRPIVDDEVRRYGKYYSAYCSVKPGLTGLWQISGRNNVSYRRRVACDVIYARRKSVGTDLRIITCTIPVVLLSHGAY